MISGIFTPEVPEGRWQVGVLGGGHMDIATVFSSGHQHFTIVSHDSEDPEGRERCEWFATQFRKAMAALGAPPEWKPNQETELPYGSRNALAIGKLILLANPQLNLTKDPPTLTPEELRSMASELLDYRLGRIKSEPHE